MVSLLGGAYAVSTALFGAVKSAVGGGQ
jgi:hypothetical protein